MTTIDRDTARAAGVEVSPQRDQFVRTGNGIIRVSSGRADELEVGGIKRSDVGLQIADNDDLNVLGHEFPVVAEPLGRGRAVAGSGLLIYGYTLHNAYYHTYRLHERKGPGARLSPDAA